MIKHLFKIISRQWRKNVWIVLELILVFPLMWYIADFFTLMYLNGRTPVGVEITDSYKVTYDLLQPENANYTAYAEGSEEPGRNFLRMVDRLREHPDVERVSIGIWHYPYCTANTDSKSTVDTLSSRPYIMRVTPDYFRVFRVAPEDGGEPEQLAAALPNGVVICRTMEKDLFREKPATGQYIMDGDSNQLRVAGVTTTMKRRADLRPHPYIFVPLKEEELLRMTEKRIWSRMDVCILARPGSYKEAGFEERFKQEMKQKLAIGNYFFVNLTPVSDLKAAMMERYGVNESVQYHTAFAIFFLLNIFLGIIGTFWLRIEKRKGEIGIRIALGAARRGILCQMLSESFLLLTIAAIPALLICLNIVVAGLMPDKDFDLTKVRFAIDTAATFALLAIVIASATWYPARRAAAIPPADALHYE